MSLPQYDWIAHHAEYTPDAVAQIDLHTGCRHTYAAMHQRIESLAAWLQHEAGVVAGDRIAVIAHNSTDVYEISLPGCAPEPWSCHSTGAWRCLNSNSF